MSAITTHVLDIGRGKPAAGVPVVLSLWGEGNVFHEVARGETDGDGRVRDLLAPSAELRPGTYRLAFDTGAYLRCHGMTVFYPEVTVTFMASDADQHYHVPLLLSPFGYSTYRGS